MEGRRLILNDGTTIEDGEAGLAEGFLWLWFHGSMQQAASLFFDSSKTSKIEFQYGEMIDTFTGFTNCISISITGGTVSVCMVKGE